MASNEVLINLIDQATSSTVFTFGKEPWRIYGEIEGLNSVSTSLITTPIASGYGSMLNGNQLPSRVLSFKVVNVTPNGRESARSELTSAIKPGFKRYNLEITYAGKTKVLKNCFLTDYNIPSGQLSNFIKAEFSFTALDPLFYGTEEETLSFSGGSGTVNLACDAPVLPRITISGASSGSRLTIQSVDTGVQYYVEVLNAPNSAIPGTIVLDTPALVNLEKFKDDNLAYLSFSTDISKLIIRDGDTIWTSGFISSVGFSFYERSYGL